MKAISLNGKWKCKPDHDKIGIQYHWYLSKNYDITNNNLLTIDIPMSFNLIEKYLFSFFIFTRLIDLFLHYIEKKSSYIGY